MSPVVRATALLALADPDDLPQGITPVRLVVPRSSLDGSAGAYADLAIIDPDAPGRTEP